MDNGAVADTLMSALTRVQTALAPPPDTAGDAEYAAEVQDDLNMEEWHSTCDAALAAFLATRRAGWKKRQDQKIVSC